jgi:hypothetical protein
MNNVKATQQDDNQSRADRKTITWNLNPSVSLAPYRRQPFGRPNVRNLPLATN